MMFCDIVIALVGYAEVRGVPAPENHKAGRAIVSRHPPHFVESHEELYGPRLSQALQRVCHDRKAWRRAARCRKMLARRIPAQ